MRTIAVTNQKGGCGKTTVSINLSACLAREGHRVLLVDMDPQGHCALGLSVPEDRIETSVADILLQDPDDAPVDLEQAVWQISANFDFLPSTLGLVRFETLRSDAENRDQILRKVLRPVAHRYEYCIIDCPPHVGLLTYNALRAGNEALVPVETGYFSLQGLAKQLDTIKDLSTRTGESIAIRVLPNCYDVRTKLAREILNELRRKYDGLLLKTFVNFNTKLKEGASLGQPITEYDNSSRGYRDFCKLARELIDLEAPARAHQDLLLEANRLAERAEELLACRSAAVLTGAVRERGAPAMVLPAEPQPRRPVDHQAIQDRIDVLYGVRRVVQGVEFNTNLPGAQAVSIAGDFNDWQPGGTPMVRQGENGHFRAVLPLDRGRYRYRLVVDGRWTRDPCNEQTELNEFGEVNSVVEIM